MDWDLANIRFLTPAEAAALLQVSKRTLQRMIKLGQLPAFKVGGQWRVRETRLRRWVDLKGSANVETDQGSDQV
jgi:excisionase family DNA binding protein